MKGYNVVRLWSLDTYKEHEFESGQDIPGGHLLVALGDLEIQDGDALLIEFKAVPDDDPVLEWRDAKAILPFGGFPLAIVRDNKVLALGNSLSFSPQEISAKFTP